MTELATTIFLTSLVLVSSITGTISSSKLRTLAAAIMFLSSSVYSVGQGLFATGAYINDNSAIDFVLGETITEYTQPAAIGFLPALNYSYVSSEKQLTDTASIQVHFDNSRQLATIFMAYELTQYRPQYYICGIDGNIYISGIINSMPHFVRYSQLPAGIYLLHIIGIPGRIPFITRWLKQ